MADLLAQSKKLYGTKDLYKVFNVSKNATSAQLKKAFYKESLKVHPDKTSDEDKSLATQKFQLISKLNKILTDEKKRKIYDTTGEIDEDDAFGLSDDMDLMSYWRELFPEISIEDIEKFHVEYKDSTEELEAVKEGYLSGKGDMQKIIDSVMCASADDEERFRGMLQPLIMSEELPDYKKFSNESAAAKKKRQSKATKEAKEAEKKMKELNGGSSSGYSDLALAMQRNREKRGDILSYLENKYAQEESVSKPKRGSKKTKTESKRKSEASDASSSRSKRQKKV